ncbi:MAG: hypothetical protein KIT43_00275 [Bauldia sp.]|nr:hypothetical protein [Bauldia sp.]
MMRFMRILAAGSAAMLTVAWAGIAQAQMAGTYTGYDAGAGATLVLEEVGNALNGQIRGDVEGALLGTTDGGASATGVVLLFGVAKLPFTGVLAGDELRLTVTGVNGEQTLVPFTRVGGAVPAPVPPTKPVPAPPAPDHAAVTEALRTLLVALVGVSFGDRPAVVQTAVVECLIEVTSPLSAAELQALVATGFEPTDDMIVQFERTVPGIDAAVGACFAAVDTPPEPAPAPVKPTPAPAPQPPAPTPVVLDDAAVDASLRTVVLGVVTREMPPAATPEQRAAAVECLMRAVAGLPTADRQHLADIGFDPNQAEVTRLETLLPGITVAVEACLEEA